MSKILVIAEKPSVAGDLARALPGKFTRRKTHYESSTHIVSYAIGHLVSICYPEEINPDWQKWDINNLPILPDEFRLKALDGTKSQLNALQKMIRRADVSEIINACDAGREGELIFNYIVSYVWNKSVAKKSFKRLWLQSMTTESIKAAFDSLRTPEEMEPLAQAALCRSESDWLIGINATRALTGYNSRRGGFFLTPCGRVQTPTLSLLVKRERARIEFVPRTYHTLSAEFTFDGGNYTGKWIDPAFKKDPADPHRRADRIWTEADWQAIIARCRNEAAAVSEESKETRQSSPQLYDLTLLQREANSRFGFSAKNTLSTAQALYEKHKLLTYPRTDSRNLPEDYVGRAKKILATHREWTYGRFAGEAVDKKYVKKDRRIFNNARISDHHAIIPTGLLPAGSLSEAELKIYTMVVQRFIAVFFPPAVYLNTRRSSLVSGETFLTEGRILKAPGWKAIYGAALDSDKDKVLAPLPDGVAVTCTELTAEEHQTRPPARYSEATLLSAMENSDKLIDDDELADAMKERGLGTPATRAAIIEKLLKEKYVVREAKELTPTGKAFELLALLEAMKIDVLASPEMTGEWEYKLNRMLKGEFTRERFMKEVRDLTVRIIEQVRSFDGSEITLEAPFSPVDGVKYISTPTAWISEDGKVSIRKILGGRMLDQQDVLDLLAGKTIGPYSDFRSKRGKLFTASVQLKNNKIEFIFAESTDNLDIEEILKTEPLGSSPVDGTPVYATPTAWLSESALNGDKKKGLRIGRIILQKELDEKHIRQLLTDGKTELISGFISKRKKPFDAWLVLDKNGRMSFEFPPRKFRNSRKKAEKKQK